VGSEGGAETAAAADPAGAFPMRLLAGRGGVGIALVVDTIDGLVLQGDRGLDPKGPEPGNASYYYSYPRLSARGTVRVAGESIPVAGEAWLDREWSTSALGAGVDGWDWFSLRLDDGSELMVYVLRRDDGTVDRYSNGVLLHPDGGRVGLGPDDFRIDVTRRWTSPTSGATYPVGWVLTVRPDSPDGRPLRLELTPWLDAQELDVAFRYWEGAVDAVGTGPDGRAVRGAGYVELTGYDDGADAAAGPSPRGAD